MDSPWQQQRIADVHVEPRRRVGNLASLRHVWENGSSGNQIDLSFVETLSNIPGGGRLPQLVWSSSVIDIGDGSLPAARYQLPSGCGCPIGPT